MCITTLQGLTKGAERGGERSKESALSSMRFHPIGGGPEDDKDGQEAWFTAGIASLIGEAGD